jgi:acetyl esterase/lipase
VEPAAAEAWARIVGAVGSDMSMTPDAIAFAREFAPKLDSVLAGRDLSHAEHVVAGVPVSVIRRADSAVTPRPCLFQVYGGGMVMGNRGGDLAPVLDWVEHFDAIVVVPEYRLAPEHPAPAAVDDTLTGLRWLLANTGELGVDPERIIAVGWSAGGGILAGAMLRHRDEGGRLPAGQLLVYPMLDDRDIGVAKTQLARTILWNKVSNDTGWNAYLGESRGGPNVSPYSAPARATDLSGLPPTYIEVGSVDLFRDEDVAYASTMWACGGDVELHVWPGGPHGFEFSAPDAPISRGARHAKLDWLARIFTKDRA